ncbi:MAG TPA: O-antigen ligase family protein, partial [Vicinamibacterales bacterium]
RPALVLAVVVAASAVVRLSAVQPTVAYPWPFAGMVFRFLCTDFFRNRATFGAITDAAMFLEGLGLFVAGVTLVGQNRALGHRLLTMVTCGAAGVAALNIGQLFTASLRTGDTWNALVMSIDAIRITVAFPDLNAAGSYLAMGLLLAAGLAFAALGRDETLGRAGVGRWLGLLWLPVVPFLALGLWLTGSRTALVAVTPAACALLPVASRASRWSAWGAICVAVLVVVLSLPFAGDRFSLSTESPRPVRVAVNYRLETTRAAFRMIAERPVFGVGVGSFYARSGEYFTPAFRKEIPGENAHNNFLQVLAELGVIGFVPFLWIIGVVGAAVATGWRSGRLPAAATAGAAGLVAFILTWLAGHPLLIFEVATAFWLVLAAVAALAVEGGVETGHPTRDHLWRWAAALIVVIAVASVPLRGRDAAQRANLTNAAIGLSAWETDDGGARFRRMIDRAAQFYVPADATSMRLPVRLERNSRDGAAVNLEIQLDGELANRVRIEGTNWSEVAMVLPRPRHDQGHRSVQISIVNVERGAEGGRPLSLDIGEPTLTTLERR